MGKFMDKIVIVLKIIVALTILNVWLRRRGKITPYRGGEARSMREEFAVYGLPYWFMCLIGTLKVMLALNLLLGIWLHWLGWLSALLLGMLMLAALFMHIKVKDPLLKSLPALIMLLMCLTIVLF